MIFPPPHAVTVVLLVSAICWAILGLLIPVAVLTALALLWELVRGTAIASAARPESPDPDGL